MIDGIDPHLSRRVVDIEHALQRLDLLRCRGLGPTVQVDLQLEFGAYVLQQVAPGGAPGGRRALNDTAPGS